MSGSLAATKIDIARIDAVLDSIQKNYATKADLLHLETRLTQMEGRLEAALAQMGECTAQMEARIAQMEARIVRWMLATLITVIGISGTVVLGVVKLVSI
jgi:hypothetical protein